MPNRKDVNNTKVAFIGLGNMGAPMAINLVNAGYNLSVYDLSETALKQLEDVGATTAASPKEAAHNADVVITMLPAGKHVKSVFLGDAAATEVTTDGLLASLNKDTLVIDSSTIAAADARIVAQAAEALGLPFIDAPVSGGTSGATAGTLTFIVGGKDEDFARAKPILQVMGKNIFHAGAQGAGQVAKICNNMLLGILMSGTAEALNLGIKHGLDAKVLSEIMLQSSGRNWTLEVYNPYPNVLKNVPSSHGYEGGFMSQHMHKDLHLALETAKDMGVDAPMGSKATELYDEHIEAHKEKDFSSIMAHFDKIVLEK